MRDLIQMKKQLIKIDKKLKMKWEMKLLEYGCGFQSFPSHKTIQSQSTVSYISILKEPVIHFKVN